MKEAFEDIRITGKPDHAKVKAGSKIYTHIFFLPLSSAPPQRWNELLVQEWASRTMQNPRHIWINREELAIDCASKELALIVERIGTDIQTANRKYRNEVESSRQKTEPERHRAEEKKRVDESSIKKAIDELKLPG